MKKVLIVAMMVLGSFSAHAYDFFVDGIYYNIVSASDLTVEVTYKEKHSGSYYIDAYTWIVLRNDYICSYSGIVTIPYSVIYEGKEYVVSRIGDYAFATSDSRCREVDCLLLVSIPESIKSIGNGAFVNCKKIVNISLPNAIERIGDDAFRGCNINNIVLPQSLSFMGDNAFYDCSILSMTIPSKVKTIGSNALPSTLKELVMTSYYPPTGSLFGGYSAEVLVPSKTKYKDSDGWKSYNLIEMLSPSTHEFVYNGNAQVVSWTNNLKEYTTNMSDVILQKNAGSYSVDVKADYYNGGVLAFSLEFPYEYTINKAHVNVKANNASREYGDDNPSFTLVYSDFVNEENESEITAFPVISTTATKDSRVGEYPITISGGSAANYEFVYESGVLTVTKAPLSAKVNDTTRLYGSQNPAFTIDYYGLKNGETAPEWTTPPTFQTDATQISGVGNYVVSATNGVPINYDLAEITAGTMSITPAPLTIKANDASRQYYSEEPAFSYYCNGFVNGDDESVLSSVPVLSTTATLTSNVGTYDIKVGEVYSSNYEISFVNGTLTITPRVLTASIGNYERLYNEDNPAFEVKYEGFVGGDNESKLKSQATASTSATKTSDVGTYPIYVSGGSADNYTFSYTSGTLTINKTEQTISWEQDLIGLKVGDQVELKAVASSGLPVTYTMDNFTAAEIYSTGSKSYLDCKAGGQFLIRAVQNGDKNYYSTPRATNTVSIIGSNPPSDPSLTIKQADNGSVSIQVSKGSVYTFTVAPSNGWKVHSVTFNNTDVTNQLSSDGRYTTPAINSNSTLYVVYEQGNSAVYSAKQSDVKIQATSSGVRVIDANIGDMIRVYTTDGLLQHTVKVDGDVIDIPLTKDDVYIVKVGAKTVKLSH